MGNGRNFEAKGLDRTIFTCHVHFQIDQEDKGKGCYKTDVLFL